MFYVYQLIDPRTKEVFYIGKGKNERMFNHVRDVKRGIGIKKNPHKYYKIKQILDSGFSDIFYNIIFTSENEQECFDKEIALIKEYGKDKLTNITDGGEGGYNQKAVDVNRLRKGKTWEEIFGVEEAKKRRYLQTLRLADPIYQAKIKEKLKGKIPWNKGKHDYTNAPRSEESKKRSSIALLNSVAHKKAMKDPNVRNRISEATKLAMNTLEIKAKCAYWKGKKKPHSLSTKRKMSLAAKGKPKSEKHKLALKEAWKRRIMKFN
ncbi:MAG: GIY-YIG nuclease family protein [Clostridia bacterium]